MESILPFLPEMQITLAVILMVGILLQQRGAGLGGAFGGSEGSVHYERRGFERTLFRATIVVSVLFVIAVALPIFVSNPYQFTPETQSNLPETTQVPLTGTADVTTNDGKDVTIPLDNTAPSTLNIVKEPLEKPAEKPAQPAQ
jgi:preprotein translocase subunit SecG